MPRPSDTDRPQPNPTNLFQDALICGVLGGGVASAFGRPFFLWAMLCTFFGPLFILAASRLVPLLPATLPGRRSGTYEFAVFALVVAVLAMINPFAR